MSTRVLKGSSLVKGSAVGRSTVHLGSWGVGPRMVEAVEGEKLIRKMGN